MSGAFLSDEVVRLFAGLTARATSLLLLAWIAAWALRRSSAAVRHHVWSLALCGLVVLPCVALLAPEWSLRVLPAQAARLRSLPPAPLAFEPVPLSRHVEPLDEPVRREFPRPQHADPVPGWTAGDVLLAVWGTGALLCALPALIGLIANERRRRSARPVTNDDLAALLETLRGAVSIRRTVELRQSEESAIPLTWGVWHPVILLPEAAQSWPEGLRRLVLFHELAHIQRCDVGLQVAGRLVAALYWFHPLAWYALGRLRLECEQACDDRVVGAGEHPADYARQLLELARSVRVPRLSLTVAMARPNSLEQRLISILDSTRSHAPLNRRSGGRLAVAAGVLILMLATVHARPRAAAAGADAPPEPPKPAAEAVAVAVAEHPGRIVGRVVQDGDGAPAPGATVILLLPPPKGQDEYYGKLPLRPITADTAGAFAFDGLAPGRYRVWANLGKLTSRRESARGQVVVLPEAGEAPKPVELRLTGGVAVITRVKDKATGKPIANATVGLGWSDFPTDATTDRDGRTVLQPLTPERWLVEAWADGYAKDTQWLNLENGSDAEAEFLLGPGGSLAGVVRDPSGKPLAGVGLSVIAAGRFRQIAYVETDNDGRYRLENLPRDADLQINVSKTDHGFKNVPARVTLVTEPLDLILEPRPHGGSIAGVVKDNQGRPIADAELINMGPSSDDVRKARSGPDGRFLLENLYERHHGKEVLVRARGFAAKRVQVQTGPADKPAEVTIALEAGHHINGRVIDEKGRPLEGVRVWFAYGRDPFSDGGKGTTDAQGRFAFDSLPPDCPFSFDKSGYSGIEDRVLPLDTGEVVTVTMVQGGVIVGKVLDAKTGQPVRAFNVRLLYSPQRRPGEPSTALLADLVDPGQNCHSNDGRFKLGDLVAGMPLQVTVAAEGYERNAAERVVVGRPDDGAVAEFRLVPLVPANLRTYAGRLLDHRGEPVPQAQLRLIAAKPREAGNRIAFPFNWQMIQSGQLARRSNVTRFLEAATDGQGRFRFTQIPRDSEVELVWWGTGIAPGRADHLERTLEDATGSITITTPAPARIVGSIDRKAFAGVVRVRVSSVESHAEFGRLDLEPDRTTFEIGDLAPGEYWVSLMAPPERVPGSNGRSIQRPLVSEKVTVAAGQRRVVEFKK